MTAPGAQGRWGDLAARIGSGIVILLVGAALLLLPLPVAGIGIAALVGGLIWELTRLAVPAPAPRLVAGIAMGAAAAMAAALYMGPPAALSLLLPLIAGTIAARPGLRAAYAGIALAMMLAAFGVLWLRAMAGLPATLWVVVIVVLSDVLGYFVGRIVGGPKFWPAISPKKTWSGTAAGWIGAAVLGLLLVITGVAPASVIVIGPILAFAGQMGDIAESWIKRRVGVKDSSQLIPGHGGLMDRFDAMTGSLGLATLLSLAGLLPAIGG